jgi:pSer/pThr/pTyr-binding forkhead associated (FHA) protein
LPARPAASRCRACGGENAADDQFCRNCGAALSTESGAAEPPPLAVAPTAPSSGALVSDAPPRSGTSPMAAQRRPCAHCGVPTPTGFRFCQNCGKAIPPISAPPTVENPPAVSGVIGAADAAGPDPALAAGPDPAFAATFTSDGRSLGRLDTPASGGAGAIGRAAGDRPQWSVWGQLRSIHRDGSAGDAYALAGDWIDVGRDADVRFDDPHLAARHARFAVDAGAVVVTPLDDLNGVYLRVSSRAPIASGTRLLLGRELLLLELLGEEERDDGALWRHGVAMFGSPIRDAWGRLSQIVSTGSVRDVRYLAGEEVTIGREEGDVVFRDDEFLSRRHCKLCWDGRLCTLEDVGSSNGSFVRLVSPRRLTVGDHIRMGDQMFRFERS